MPLMQALGARKTTRAFADKPLPLQTLSNLLWAAFGVNRPREVKPGLGRTAPSARNTQDITLDVVLADGVYIYDAEQNLLRPVLAGDLRGAISPAPAAHAAVTIIYVAPAKDDYAQVDAGFIGQNVYLFAASEGLNAWFYALRATRRGREAWPWRRPQCSICAIGRLSARVAWLFADSPLRNHRRCISEPVEPSRREQQRAATLREIGQDTVLWSRLRLARARRRVIEFSVRTPDPEVIRTAGKEKIRWQIPCFPPKSAT